MKVLKTKINPNTAIIGDVHQCNAMLTKMIDTCQEAGVKNFIFLGDLLDRGEDPIGTVDTLKKIKDISTFIVGNHDMKYIKYYYGRGVSLSEDQTKTVALFKENGEYFKDYYELFYQEWVAILDEEQKVMLSHAPGYRPFKFNDRYNRHDIGKNDYARLLYGITNGDTENGVPIRLNLTENAEDNLEGWTLIHGHTHGGRLYTEPSPNVLCLDFKAGQADGRLAAWVVEDTVKNGKLLVINQSLEAVWNPACDMFPYKPV